MTDAQPRAESARWVVEGYISSAGFGRGDRIVVGHWPVSPIGPFGDVMWATPDDERILLAPSDEAAAFITAIYEFDSVRVGPLEVSSDGRTTVVSAAQLRLHLEGGRLRPVPIRRPLALTRFIEGPIAKLLMGVDAYGTSTTGAREWYQTRGWRWVTRAAGSVAGEDLGPPGPFAAPIGVGFSEPPRRPSIVAVRVTIELPAPLDATGPARPPSGSDPSP